MDTPGSSSRSPAWPPPFFRSRRWLYIAGTMWSLVTALAAYQWAIADDSRGHWLAGIQCFLGLALAITSFVQAKSMSD